MVRKHQTSEAQLRMGNIEIGFDASRIAPE
jgi:hypothetical protein